MLTVYLIRAFVRDLVEHVARVRGGAGAVRLDAGIARRIGIGNSTGLGMAPFIVNHPRLFDRWIGAREEALARVRSVERASPEAQAVFLDLLGRSEVSAARWHSTHPVQAARIAGLRADLERLRIHVGNGAALDGPRPWDALHRWAEAHVDVECQEALVSLVLEPHGALVDDLADAMACDDETAHPIDGRVSIGHTRRTLEAVHGWALGLDWEARDQTARAWYVSAEKLEPRLGERFEEPIAPLRAAAGPRARRLRAAPGAGRLAGGRAGRGVPAAPSRAPPRAAARAGGGRVPLRRDPRQHHLRRGAAHRHAAREALVLRRGALRPALGPLGAHLPVRQRAVPRGARPRRRRHLALSSRRAGHRASRRASRRAGRRARRRAGGRAGVSLSLGELEALCRKAARGAGFDWGTAEEAGRAVRRLAGVGLPGAELLLGPAGRGRGVAGGASARRARSPGRGRAARARCVRCSRAPRSPTRPSGWARPARSSCGTSSRRCCCLPFAGLAARRLSRPVSIAWAGFAATGRRWCGAASGRAGARANDERAATVRCRVEAEPPAGEALPRAARARPDADCLRGLEALAQRTYAPATEESRARGAGGADDG